MADELVDICDESNNLSGIQKMKSEAHRLGLWHRAAHLWLYNQAGDILLQLRAKEKLFFPELWDISVAGHVTAGEDPIVSGLRETQEEIGLQLKEEELEFFSVRPGKSVFGEIINNEFYYIYLVKFAGTAENLELQTSEVESVKFFPLNKLESELKLKAEFFVPHGDYWLDMIQAVKSRIENF